jgi:hypothetical protein
MNKRNLFVFGILFVAVVANAALGQTTSTTEVGPDGVTYQVTRQVVQRSVPTTEYQAREERVYSPRLVTDYQSFQQTYATPVTQYHMVSRLRGRWNPFVQPYWTHDLEPVTRWEFRPATVQIPVSRTDWVEQTRTVQVPVTTYRTVNEEYTSRVALNVPPAMSRPAPWEPARDAQPMVATAPNTSRSRYGSERISNDPPREGTLLR